MAVGFAPAEANQLLDALIAEYPWIKLHIGDPGVAGAANVAGNDTRKDSSAAFSPASAGTSTSDVTITWTDPEVDATEDYTHFSAWTASTAGTFGYSGLLTANAVTATGDAFTIDPGGIVLALTVAS